MMETVDVPLTDALYKIFNEDLDIFNNLNKDCQNKYLISIAGGDEGATALRSL